ncbi:hypothetical protein ACTNBQ_09250, partial [Ligilactobacillus salivarius]
MYRFFVPMKKIPRTTHQQKQVHVVHGDVYPQSWKSTLGVFYMTKISVKTKLKAVEEYANGNV